jgi:hypothetical protein
MLAEGRLTLEPSLGRLIRELEEYRYETDDEGEPLDQVEDKSKFHRIDALGYIVSAEMAGRSGPAGSYLV